MRPAGSRVVALRALCERRGLPQSCVPPSPLSVKSSELKNVLVSRISLLKPARPGLFTIAALTVVPSVLHGMAPRRVACELPGGVVLRSFYSQKNIVADN
jgi:hypothetical protein